MIPGYRYRYAPTDTDTDIPNIPLWNFETRCWRTDGPTDQPTDWRTLSRIELLSQLKSFSQVPFLTDKPAVWNSYRNFENQVNNQSFSKIKFQLLCLGHSEALHVHSCHVPWSLPWCYIMAYYYAILQNREGFEWKWVWNFKRRWNRKHIFNGWVE